MSNNYCRSDNWENSIISPRSVVTQDIPDYCIAVGNPARVVKRIDH